MVLPPVHIYLMLELSALHVSYKLGVIISLVSKLIDVSYAATVDIIVITYLSTFFPLRLACLVSPISTIAWHSQHLAHMHTVHMLAGEMPHLKLASCEWYKRVSSKSFEEPHDFILSTTFGS